LSKNLSVTKNENTLSGERKNGWEYFVSFFLVSCQLLPITYYLLPKSQNFCFANQNFVHPTQSIAQDLQLQEVILSELHIDRAYLSCHWVKLRDDSLKIFCKAYPVRRGDKFEKTAFVLDGELKCYSRRQKAKGKRQRAKGNSLL
jgi:hypothetical protein